MDLDDAERATVYYTSLLVNVGCHTDAYEQAKWFGDDIELKSGKFEFEPRSLGEAASMVRMIGAGTSPLDRLRTGLELATSSRKAFANMLIMHGRLAGQLARDGLTDEVGDALVGSYEQWDGWGSPGTLAGSEIPHASRIALVAEYAEVAHRTVGVDAAVELAERRAGKMFDPALAACLRANSNEIFGSIDGLETWGGDRRGARARPPSRRSGIRDRTDCDRGLRRPQAADTLGHARATSELAAAAARDAGLGDDDGRALRQAGLVVGFGRLGVSNAIWDKPGPLSVGERERVRMQPYFTERMLQQSDALAPLGRLAVADRERLDGSGYPRGLPASIITLPLGSSARPTPTRRCESPGPTARRSNPTRLPRSCGPKCATGAWTATPSTPSLPPRGTAPPVDAKDPPASPPVRSRFSPWSLWD